MAPSSDSQPRFSIGRLRIVILVCLAVGVATYTAAMLSNTRTLSEQFGPQVRADLEWRVLRGAQELARAGDLGLVTGDAEIVRQSFGVYAKTSDVAAIVAVNGAGELVASHGRAPEPAAKLFAGPPGGLREGPSYLVSWAEASIEGSAVGQVAVVVSTERHTRAMALLERARKTALTGGAAALVLGFVVVGFFTRAVAQRDAQLSNYAGNLERMVAERTAQLDERNRGMRLVLDNVVQGFLTIDTAGVLSSERSAIVDRWFGAPRASSTLSEFLKPHAPDFAGWVEMGLDQLREDALPAELVLDQMPKRFSAGSRTFDVIYGPIEGAQGAIDRLLVIISDVTEALAHERTEREQRELVGLFQRISVDRSGVEEFLTEAAGLVSAIRSESVPAVQKRLVHTLKGNCAIYGLLSYAQLAHDIEGDLVASGEGLSPAQREQLVAVWKDAMVRVGRLLGGARRDALEVERTELDAALAKMRAGEPGAAVLPLLEAWRREPVGRRLERLAHQARTVAERLGKPEPVLEIADGGVRLDPDNLRNFWSTMVHVVRNAVDHGLEERGTLRFSAERSGGSVIIRVADDGRGVQWDALRKKAERLGLPAQSEADLVEALFADGVSTKDEASDVSGRGVGLAALRQVVGELAGRIEVHSELGKGTTFVFTFAESTCLAAPRRRDPELLASLMPPNGLCA